MTSYPRDLVGYADQPPDPRWPGRARLALNFVVNYEEGGERSVVRKDNCMVKPSAVAFVLGNPNNGVGPRQWRRLPGKPPAPAK